MNTGEIILAPMEGVLDYPLREAITDYNHYDYCVSEFIRISDVIFPGKVFRREVPELKNEGRTRNGTPVWVQLLGTIPETLAQNALVAVRCGALGIDLNFGCPSRMVHRSGGGAAMLKNPKLIGEAVRRTRDVLPAEIPLSAKIRLGWENPDDVYTIYDEIVRAGADKIVIHARTRKDAYKAEEIKWHYITPFADKGEVAIVANGEIKDRESAMKCIEVTHCPNIMIGRAGVSVPNIERHVRTGVPKFTLLESVAALVHFIDIMKTVLPEQYQMARTKQFLGYMRMVYPEVNSFFRDICHQTSQHDIDVIIDDVLREKRPVFIVDKKEKDTGDSPESAQGADNQETDVTADIQ